MTNNPVIEYGARVVFNDGRVDEHAWERATAQQIVADWAHQPDVARTELVQRSVVYSEWSTTDV